jgi:hypothetical protein
VEFGVSDGLYWLLMGAWRALVVTHCTVLGFWPLLGFRSSYANGSVGRSHVSGSLEAPRPASACREKSVQSQAKLDVTTRIEAI